MKRAIGSLLAVGVFLAMAGASYGQGGTTSTLAGVVVDGSGALIPGADVVARHNATGVSVSAVTNAEGAFSFPALNIGTYTVTVTLQGFKTVVINNVVLTSGAGANVEGDAGSRRRRPSRSPSRRTSEIVQTQSSTSRRRSTPTRSPSCRSPAAARWTSSTSCRASRRRTATARRRSTACRAASINITLDGVNIQDNTLRIDRRLLRHRQPALDAIEEVTVTTAAQGADAAGRARCRSSS